MKYSWHERIFEIKKTIDLLFRKKRDQWLSYFLGGRKHLRRAVFSRSSSKYLDALLIRDEAGALFSIEPDDDMIARNLILTGRWQYQEMQEVLVAFKQKNNGANAVFVDIGSHVGIHLVTAMKSNLFKMAYGFEMTPQTFRHLQRNILLNGLDKRVLVFNKALTLKPKNFQIQEVYQNKGANYVVSNQDLFIGSSSILHSVNLSDFSKAENLGLEDLGLAKLFWLDAEGLELEIIESFYSLLNFSTDVVSLEFNPNAYNKDHLLRVLDLLFSSFKKCVVLNGNGRFISKSELLVQKTQIDIMFI